MLNLILCELYQQLKRGKVSLSTRYRLKKEDVAIHRKEGITGQKKHWTRALDGGDKNGVHTKGKTICGNL